MAAALKSLVIVGALAVGSTEAAAVTDYVKSACREDYYAYCGEHAVDSASLRICMRKAQYKLSRPCLRALKRAGEVTRRDEMRYRAHYRNRD
jgi:hypothetical protein